MTRRMSSERFLATVALHADALKRMRRLSSTPWTHHYHLISQLPICRYDTLGNITVQLHHLDMFNLIT